MMIFSVKMSLLINGMESIEKFFYGGKVSVADAIHDEIKTA